MKYSAFTQESPGPFGLWYGKCVSDPRRVRGYHSTWIDRSCVVLGRGQLSVDDIGRIAREIPEGESFVVLTNNGDIGNVLLAHAKGELSGEGECGLLRLELIECIAWVIRSQQLIIVTLDGPKKPRVVNRSDWERKRRFALERNEPVPPRILAWQDLDSSVEILTIGRHHVLSLVDFVV